MRPPTTSPVRSESISSSRSDLACEGGALKNGITIATSWFNTSPNGISNGWLCGWWTRLAHPDT
ncbi:hypothetical protein GBA52_008724 [Prunus armeniaca]|nr:hypothetical protein GBA52_008724 [Prunus armeniaca]